MFQLEKVKSISRRLQLYLIENKNHKFFAIYVYVQVISTVYSTLPYVCACVCSAHTIFFMIFTWAPTVSSCLCLLNFVRIFKKSNVPRITSQTKKAIYFYFVKIKMPFQNSSNIFLVVIMMGFNAVAIWLFCHWSNKYSTQGTL